MDTLDNQSFNDKNSGLTPAALETIRTTVPWMKFIAIMGFIFIGFVVIGAFMSGATGTDKGMVQMLTNLVAAVLGFFPTLFLFQYANNLSYFLESKQSFDMEQAMLKQKNYYIFAGVIMILAIVLILLVFLYALGRSM
jgi:hypothetical protein